MGGEEEDADASERDRRDEHRPQITHEEEPADEEDESVEQPVAEDVASAEKDVPDDSDDVTVVSTDSTALRRGSRRRQPRMMCSCDQ